MRDGIRCVQLLKEWDHLKELADAQEESILMKASISLTLECCTYCTKEVPVGREGHYLVSFDVNRTIGTRVERITSLLSMIEGN